MLPIAPGRALDYDPSAGGRRFFDKRGTCALEF